MGKWIAVKLDNDTFKGLINGLETKEIVELLHLLAARFKRAKMFNYCDDLELMIEHLNKNSLHELTEEEKNYLRKGSVVSAVKSIRERLGLGLREAKAMADEWRKENVNV